MLILVQIKVIGSLLTNYINIIMESCKTDIPNLIPDFQPTIKLSIQFPNHEVEDGKRIPIEETHVVPKISFQTEKDKYYTLMAVDPDVPELFKPALHWYIINISSDFSYETISDWYGASPPWKHGPHRYIFVLFEQKQKLNKEEVTNIVKYEGSIIYPVKWNRTQELMKKFELVPVGLNYFVGERESCLMM